jgi:hypothetical protein
MKITFFLIAFCLVFVRLYLGWTGHWGHDGNDGTMTIRNDGEDLEIKWSGKVRLNKDETAVESITPGGYLKFKHNDEKFAAESNLQGEISYNLFDGRQQLILDEKGKKFLAQAIHEMIELGYDAQGRMNRIYEKAGINGLIDEMQRLKNNDLKNMYTERVLKSDSLTHEQLGIVLTSIGQQDADWQKENLLKRFTAKQLKDSSVREAWLQTVKAIPGDNEKSNLLKQFIARDTVSRKSFGEILDITDRINQDWEKQALLTQLITRDSIPSEQVDPLLDVIGRVGDENAKEDLLSRLIDKDSLSGESFHRLMNITAHFNADWERQNLYKKLIERGRLSEEDWAGLIVQAAHTGSDFDKSAMLVDIARKMPKTEELKAAYRQAARAINTDSEYGKALRAVE